MHIDISVEVLMHVHRVTYQSLHPKSHEGFTEATKRGPCHRRRDYVFELVQKGQQSVSCQYQGL